MRRIPSDLYSGAIAFVIARQRVLSAPVLALTMAMTVTVAVAVVAIVVAAAASAVLLTLPHGLPFQLFFVMINRIRWFMPLGTALHFIRSDLCDDHSA